MGNEEALSMYTEATTDLEEALTLFADSASPPKWLEDMRHAPCTTWDYPKLAWTQLSWHYMAGIQTCSSPLLHTRTFLLVRVAHLLFVLERAWSVSELAISTLHCMAREIKMLNVSLVPSPLSPTLHLLPLIPHPPPSPPYPPPSLPSPLSPTLHPLPLIPHPLFPPPGPPPSPPDPPPHPPFSWPFLRGHLIAGRT